MFKKYGMFNKNRAVILFALLSGFAPVLSFADKPTSESIFDYKLEVPFMHTLSNGMRIVVKVDRRAPVVSHTIWYDAGGADEPIAQSGVAHFLEHLMFKGTQKTAPGAFSKRVAAIGGEDNAFTTRDYTAYYQNIAKEYLPEVMAMEADRMRNLKLDDEEIRRERDVVLQERKMRVDNNPASAFGEQIYAALYRNHPYRRPVIGWKREILALTRKEAYRFYRKFYAPNNALLTVVGDVDPQEVVKLAQQTFGKHKPSPDIEKITRPEEPPQNLQRKLIFSDEKVENPVFYLAAQSFSPVKEERKYNALALALHAFGGGTTSRLYLNLVEKDKIAVYAGAGLIGGVKDAPPVSFSVMPDPAVSLEVIETAVLKQIERFKKEGVTEKELLRAKKNIVADFIADADSRGDAASLWGGALILGMKPESIQNYPEHINSITKAEVDTAFREVFTPGNRVIGYLLPKETRDK